MASKKTNPPKSALPFLLLSGLAVVACSCSLSTSGTSAPDNVSNAVDSVITSISGAADDGAGSDFAAADAGRATLLARLGRLEWAPSAWAASCVRAIDSSCSASSPYVKAAAYSDCTIGSTDYALSGSTTLTFSGSGCPFSASGDSLVRTMDFTRTGPLGGGLETTSAAAEAYNGTLVSGGQTLTDTGSGYTLTIGGVQKILTLTGGAVLYNHSIRSTSDVQLSQLARGGRTMTAGTIQVYHNLDKYTATFSVAQALSWTADCCYPVSGSMNVSFSGSLSGDATVTYGPSCGTATLTQGQLAASFTMSYCE